jgi:hypothetical protein
LYKSIIFYNTRHYYDGKFHRVPKEWDFPRCGVRDLWRQWWIGDGIRQIPPLRMIKHIDVEHIDKRPISQHELHGRRGKHKDKRRKATKILCDMKFLIKHIQQVLEEQDIRFLPNELVTQRKVNSMFASINDTFLVHDRDVQKSWVTIVRDLREAGRGE